jgi:CRISPR-associated Csx10 family RAMP protein
MSCKREGPAHGVKDVLIPRVQSLDSGLAKTEALANILVCDRCGEPRKPQSGYQVGLEPVPTAVRLFNMHVGIDRRRVSASPGILYGIESIAPTYQAEDGAWHPMKLTGVGQLAQDDVEVLNEVCSEPIWLGKNRSRGNGQADLALRVLEPARDRVETIVSGCRTLQKLLGTEEGSVFTIDVVSPIIAYDRYLRATSEPAEWLPADLKPQVMDRLQLTTTVSGWDMATGLPKDETSAVAPGTVVVVISPLPAKEVGERLATLETTGVGERLCEGFGQAKFNDTFRFRGE